MALKLNGGLSLKTSYSLKLLNIETGEEREYIPKNVLLNDLFKRFKIGNANDASGSFSEAFSLAYFGTGTGTPAATDTALFSALSWSAHGFYADSHVSTVDPTLNVIHWVSTFTVPASEDYTGSISEILIKAHNQDTTEKRPTVHALIYDAQDNPITINKTDLDILILTLNFDLTVSDGATLSVVPGLFDWLRTTTAQNFMTDIDPLAWLCFKGFNGLKESVRGEISSIISPGVLHGLAQHNMVSLSQIKETKHLYDFSHYAYASISYKARYRYVVLGIGLLLNDINNSAYTEYEDGGIINVSKRIAQTDLAGTFYFKALRVANFWEVTFPNATIFPDYAINGIEVLVAAGGEQDVEPPLPYWKAGTHTIYKNGTPLVENTDYTIDNINNRTKNIELMAITEATNDAPLEDAYIIRYIFPSERLIKHASYSDSNMPKFKGLPQYLAQSTPIVLQFKSGEKINRFQNPSSNTTLKLEYSSDGTTYTEEGIYSQGEHTITERSTTAYPYWRITPMTGLLATSSLGNTAAVTDMQDNLSNMILLYYYGNPIHFNTALTAGDVITMDCSVDMPLKTDNNVIDIDMTIDLLGN